MNIDIGMYCNLTLMRTLHISQFPHAILLDARLGKKKTNYILPDQYWNLLGLYRFCIILMKLPSSRSCACNMHVGGNYMHVYWTCTSIPDIHTFRNMNVSRTCSMHVKTCTSEIFMLDTCTRNKLTLDVCYNTACTSWLHVRVSFTHTQYNKVAANILK